MILELENLLKNKAIKDIKIAGFIDYSDIIREFSPYHKKVYFEFDDLLLEFESIEQYSKLKISIVEEMKLPNDLIVDEDEMEVAFCSIDRIVLLNPMSDNNRITRMVLFNISETKNSIICDALNLTLNNGQNIFLDPTFLSGIKIGGIDQMEFWKDNCNCEISTYELIFKL